MQFETVADLLAGMTRTQAEEFLRRLLPTLERLREEVITQWPNGKQPRPKQRIHAVQSKDQERASL